MKLRLAPILQQQQILAPQMILSMDILQLSAIDLENRIDREFMENPALELVEADAEENSGPATDTRRDPEVDQLMRTLDSFESRYGGEQRVRRGSAGDDDAKYKALQNHPGRAQTLVDVVEEQLAFLDLDSIRARICLELAADLDHRGYLTADIQEVARSLSVPVEFAEEAHAILKKLEPRGIGARDLKECLLLQLGDHDGIERRIVENHLPDLLENRLPKIASALGCSLDEVKGSVENISTLNPSPGDRYATKQDNPIVPEVFVDETDGEFKVRIEDSTLPELRISPACSAMLREAGDNPKVLDFVRRKIESARWLIHAIDQRRRTLLDIAQSIVDKQVEFFRRGPGHLAALTMKTVAEDVEVHVSTVSRATCGKYVQTPYGVMELRRFFTGGVERADGGIESRDNVCGILHEIIKHENPRRPFSDSLLTKKLQERGLDIARRTVTKYRERAGIPAARLRKQH